MLIRILLHVLDRILLNMKTNNTCQTIRQKTLAQSLV